MTNFLHLAYFRVALLIILPCMVFGANTPAQQALKTGLQRQKNSHYAQAIPAYQRALLLNPQDALPWRQLAICHYQLKDLPAAIHAADRYRVAKPQDIQFKRWTEKLKKMAHTEGMGTAKVRKQEKRSSVQKIQKNSLPIPRVTSWGLRIGGGVALGAGFLKAGQDINPNGKTFSFNSGGIPTARIELLMGLNPWWEIGLGAHPRFIDLSEQTSVPGNSNQTRQTQAKITIVPLIATIYGRLPFSASWSVEAGLGGGFATGGTLHVHDATIQTFVSGLNRTATDQKISLPGGAALHATLGLTWKLTTSSELNFGAEYLYASLPANETAITQTTVDANGTDLNPPIQFSLSGGESLILNDLGLTAGMTFRF